MYVMIVEELLLKLTHNIPPSAPMMIIHIPLESIMRESKMNKYKCVYCKKILDTTKDNYGWHNNKKGELEKCYFANASNV
jgi:hypothetical protein